jgi:hypothetical protein
LQEKEILQALRKKVTPREFFRKFDAPRESFRENPRKVSEEVSRREISDEDISKLRSMSSEIKGKNVLVVNDKLEIVGNVLRQD